MWWHWAFVFVFVMVWFDLYLHLGSQPGRYWVTGCVFSHVVALSFCICIGLICIFIWAVRLCDSEWVSCRVLFPRGDLELVVYMAWCGAIRDTIFTLILLLIMSKHCETRWYYRWDAFQHILICPQWQCCITSSQKIISTFWQLFTQGIYILPFFVGF